VQLHSTQSETLVNSAVVGCFLNISVSAVLWMLEIRCHTVKVSMAVTA